MKITKELKEVIQRQLDRRADIERKEKDKERREIVNELNKTMIESDEFKALVAAARAWDEKINAAYEKNKDNALIASGYQSWYMGSYLADMENRLPAPFSVNHYLARKKYDDIRDTILLKLAYEKDFEKAMAILAEYGITLG